MPGYRDDSKNRSFVSFVRDSISANNLFFFLFAPILFGSLLLLNAERGSYLEIGIGVLLLASAPFVARKAWKSHFHD